MVKNAIEAKPKSHNIWLYFAVWTLEVSSYVKAQSRVIPWTPNVWYRQGVPPEYPQKQRGPPQHCGEKPPFFRLHFDELSISCPCNVFTGVIKLVGHVG